MSTTTPTLAHRDRARDELGRSAFDVLVVGGGIIGISTAWTASQAGLRVALVDGGDFAGATSSASTKLVHGGLRYLQTGNLRLVSENHRERRELARHVAPHLVNRRTFLVPVYRDGPHGAAKLGAGVALYSALSGFGDGVGRLVGARRATELVPSLRADGLRAAAVYTDHQMNDARMAVMTVRAAVEAGATVLNHARVEDLLVADGRVVGAEVRDVLTGEMFDVRATRVVNATGPWLDRLRRLENPFAASSVRLSKGAHLVIRPPAQWQAGLTVPVDRSRVSFAIPWEDHLLVGTTDEEYDGDPARVAVTDADVSQILGELEPAVALASADVVSTFSGVRVLPLTEGNSSHAPRETVITEGPGGMLSVAGGKWTTFRHIGRQVADRLGVPLPTLDRMPLPGIASPVAITGWLIAEGLPADVAAHLASHYGSHALDLARLVRAEPRLADRLHPDGPDIAAQVVHARDHEWAADEDDVLRRRTTVALRGLDTPAVRSAVRALLAH